MRPEDLERLLGVIADRGEEAGSSCRPSMASRSANGRPSTQVSIKACLAGMETPRPTRLARRAHPDKDAHFEPY